MYILSPIFILIDHSFNIYILHEIIIKFVYVLSTIFLLIDHSFNNKILHEINIKFVYILSAIFLLIDSTVLMINFFMKSSLNSCTFSVLFFCQLTLHHEINRAYSVSHSQNFALVAGWSIPIPPDPLPVPVFATLSLHPASSLMLLPAGHQP